MSCSLWRSLEPSLSKRCMWRWFRVSGETANITVGITYKQKHLAGAHGLLRKAVYGCGVSHVTRKHGWIAIRRQEHAVRVRNGGPTPSQ